MARVTHRRAPLRALEYPVLPGITGASPGCYDCLPWTFEVFYIAEDDGDPRWVHGEVWIREMHAVDCRVWDILDRDRDLDDLTFAEAAAGGGD